MNIKIPVPDTRTLTLQLERRVEDIEEDIKQVRHDVDYYPDEVPCDWEEGRITEIEDDILDVRKSIDALHRDITQTQEQIDKILDRLDALEEQ